MVCSCKEEMCNDERGVQEESKGMGVMEKRGEKGKGKEKENGKKWKQDEEEDDDKYVEDREVEIETGRRSFMTARMVMMGMVVEKLQVENEML